MPEADGKYRGPFCTGHTFFPMTAVNFYTETLNHEFREEYKQAHNVHTPSVRNTEVPPMHLRHPGVRLPLAGTPTARLMPGGRPPRREPLSSGLIGGWWSDPIFSQDVAAISQANATDEKVPPPCLGISTSSAIGSYWHDKNLSARDEHTETQRKKNGIKRYLTEQTLSRFPLEALPIEHRLL